MESYELGSELKELASRLADVASRLSKIEESQTRAEKIGAKIRARDRAKIDVEVFRQRAGKEFFKDKNEIKSKVNNLKDPPKILEETKKALEDLIMQNVKKEEEEFRKLAPDLANKRMYHDMKSKMAFKSGEGPFRRFDEKISDEERAKMMQELATRDLVSYAPEIMKGLDLDEKEEGVKFEPEKKISLKELMESISFDQDEEEKEIEVYDDEEVKFDFPEEDYEEKYKVEIDGLSKKIDMAKRKHLLEDREDDFYEYLALNILKVKSKIKNEALSFVVDKGVQYILNTDRDYDEPKNDEAFLFYAKTMLKDVESVKDPVSLIKGKVSDAEVLMNWRLNRPRSIREKLRNAYKYMSREVADLGETDDESEQC